MSRPREFDQDELLDKIALIFLENGLQNTSMRQLESLTGVKQVSLYNAFGNKEKMFIAAFNHWEKIAIDIQDKYMKNNGIEGIINFLEAKISKNSPFPLPKCGCMAVNTAMLVKEVGPEIKSLVLDYREGFVNRIYDALVDAEKKKEINKGHNLKQLAEMVLSSIWGTFVAIRLSEDQSKVGKPAVKALSDFLRSL